MQKTQPVSLTIAAPCYNEAAVISYFVESLIKSTDELSLQGIQVCILIVNDGSTDNTGHILAEMATKQSCLRAITFSRNFGHQAAVAAAISCSNTDALIIMDCDMQHPPDLIPRMVQAWQAGSDIVSMVRESTDSQSFAKRISSSLFYRLFNAFSATPLQEGASDFYLLGPKPLAALRQLREYHPFWRAILSWIGFRRTYLKYTAPARAAGASKYSLGKMLSLAGDGLTSFSTKPMKAVLGMGLLALLVGLLYLSYVLVATVVFRSTIPGWASLIGVTIALGGIQILVLGMIGVYIGKIFEEVKQRPLYIISEETAACRSIAHTHGTPSPTMKDTEFRAQPSSSK